MTTQETINLFINRAQNKIGTLGTLIAQRGHDKQSLALLHELKRVVKVLTSEWLDWTDQEILEVIEYYNTRADLNSIPFYEIPGYQVSIVTGGSGGGSVSSVYEIPDYQTVTNELINSFTLANPERFKGPKGDAGINGITPQKNVDYFDGAKGDKGDKGDRGPAGIDGAPGKDGINGTNGTNGLTPSISVGSVTVGTDATATVTGEITNLKLNLVLVPGPKGDTGTKGDKGDNYRIDARGSLLNRASYDTSARDFVYLVDEPTDTEYGYIYFSNGDGTWSNPFRFVGDSGWSPTYGLETRVDGSEVIYLSGFIGGEGTPPIDTTAVRYYLTPTGYSTDINFATNVKGTKGDTGLKGDPGPQGIRGLQGIQGFKGDTGDKGDKGDTGDIGPMGPQGFKGDTGDPGPQGIQGIQGPQGVQGDQGPIGPQGPAGVDGQDGASTWDAITGKPDFPTLYEKKIARQSIAPTDTTVLWVDTTGTPATFKYHNGTTWVLVGAASSAVDWSTITNKPTTFTPSAHNHSATEITSGELNDARLSANIARRIGANTWTGADNLAATKNARWQNSSNSQYVEVDNDGGLKSSKKVNALGGLQENSVDLSAKYMAIRQLVVSDINSASLVPIRTIPETEKAKLRDDANWTGSKYTGVPIVNTYMGQMLGEEGIDEVYEYVCRANNVWRRIGL